MVSTNCTVGTTTANPCPEIGFGLTQGLTNPPFDNAHASAFAQVIEPTLENITVHAAAGVTFDPCLGCPPQPVPLGAAAIASVNDVDYTTGPMRSGVIQITQSINDNRGTGFPNWSISDGSHSYSGCLAPGNDGFSCSGTATFPFGLGVPFIVNAGAFSGAGIIPPQTIYGQDQEVDLKFTVFEADGTTPVAVLPTPEPSTYALLLCGMGLLPLLLLKRHVAARRHH